MLIAVDHGNYAIKTPNFSFVSGLAEHTVRPPLAEEILEYDGRYWTLSGKRISDMRDKTQDNRFYILTLFAIAKELEKQGAHSPLHSIDLAVGFPPEHYGVLKDRFAKYFKRDGAIRFTYKDRPYMISINRVMVFPQAYAAIIPNSAAILKTMRVFLIDIGGYTTDVLLLRHGKPDMQFCRSLESGIITLNNEIIRKVNSLHDLLIDDEHISAVLQGEDTILSPEVKATILSAPSSTPTAFSISCASCRWICAPIPPSSSAAAVSCSVRFSRALPLLPEQTSSTPLPQTPWAIRCWQRLLCRQDVEGHEEERQIPLFSPVSERVRSAKNGR